MGTVPDSTDIMSWHEETQVSSNNVRVYSTIYWSQRFNLKWLMSQQCMYWQHHQVMLSVPYNIHHSKAVCKHSLVSLCTLLPCQWMEVNVSEICFVLFNTGSAKYGNWHICKYAQPAPNTAIAKLVPCTKQFFITPRDGIQTVRLTYVVQELLCIYLCTNNGHSTDKIHADMFVHISNKASGNINIVCRYFFHT